MSKPRKHQPAAGAVPPLLFVKVQRLARPATPWAWAWTIHKDAATNTVRRSIRFYRSAEEAWAAGRAVVDRIGKCA